MGEEDYDVRATYDEVVQVEAVEDLQDAVVRGSEVRDGVLVEVHEVLQDEVLHGADQEAGHEVVQVLTYGGGDLSRAVLFCKDSKMKA